MSCLVGSEFNIQPRNRPITEENKTVQIAVCRFLPYILSSANLSTLEVSTQ